MLWLAELVYRLVWTSTDGVVRFQLAMVAVVVQVVGAWRHVEWVARRWVPMANDVISRDQLKQVPDW